MTIQSAQIDAPLGHDGDPVPAAYAGLAPLPLAQYWCGAMPREKGHAFVAHCRQGLRFYSWFEEMRPYTTATENNQKLYLLGSVAEFFIHPQGTCEYWEIHLSPNGLIMDIRIPERDRMMAGRYAWEELTAADSHAQYQVQAGPTSWAAEILIPWKSFGRTGIPAGENWGIAVCRYNYPGKLENPELSATAPFTQLSFHRLEEYNRLLFS